MRKARSKPRHRAKPKAKPRPLSGGSSPSAGCASPAASLIFLSPAKPRTRKSPLAASPFPASGAAASMSTVADLRSLAASHLDSLKRHRTDQELPPTATNVITGILSTCCVLTPEARPTATANDTNATEPTKNFLQRLQNAAQHQMGMMSQKILQRSATEMVSEEEYKMKH